MFETVEVGRKISKSVFKEREPDLWRGLLQVQRDLKEHAGFPVIIDFAGVHGAGKCTTINTLNKWMDPRWIVTHAYGEPSQQEADRPEFWRYWRELPMKGTIGMYLSGRYSRPVLDFVYSKISAAEFDARLDRINAFERTLADDGALVMKFWMHLGREEQKERLQSLEQDPLERWRVTELDWKHWEMYDKFIAAAEHAIGRTSTGAAPWQIVEGQNHYYRHLRAGALVHEAIARHLDKARLDDERRLKLLEQEKSNGQPPANDADDFASERKTILDTLDMSMRLSKRAFKTKMKRLSSKLNALHHRALEQKVSIILVFEGPDAAGKGGIIRRLTRALDAQNYNVVAFAAPTEEEARHNYLWRFWRRLPRAGMMTIFDRSWYGRVLVERVEHFATTDEWSRAYAEIREFEAQLTDHKVVLLKFWINITKDEQLRRFNARKETPHKRWKLTDEDWRNRENWEKYELATHGMVQKTSTPNAPWNIIEGNDKLYARARVAEIVCEELESALAPVPDTRENTNK